MHFAALFGTVDQRLQVRLLLGFARLLGGLATLQSLLFIALFGLFRFLEDVLFERANVRNLNHAALQALAARILLLLFAHLAFVLFDFLDDFVLLAAGDALG